MKGSPVSDHAERTHPVSGIVFAIILAGIIVWLLGASAGLDQAALLAIVLVGWGVVSALVFGPKDAEEH